MTGDDNLYTVHVLEVTETEHAEILDAFAEFWRRVLSEGTLGWDEPWENLLFEFWTDSGLFVANFMNPEGKAPPHLFKMSVNQIEDEYRSISNLPDSFKREHKALENRWWQVLCEAAREPSVSAMIRDVRNYHELPIWGTYCYYEEFLFKLDV